MIVSMTGFGKSVAEFPGIKFTIEIRSLNNKGLDASVKLPSALRDKEPEIRNLLSQRLERGKIDFIIFSENSVTTAGPSINKTLATKFYNELYELRKELKDEACESLLPLVLRLPDVFRFDIFEFDEKDWIVLKEKINESISSLDEFRKVEGKILEEDLLLRTNLIIQYLNDIEPFEEQRIQTITDRIRTSFQKICKGDLSAAPDENRLEQELIYYIERLDITEEKIRLKKHCDYFLETMNEPASQGKKLGFIIQEMGREINTIGSKANDAEIQKIVVRMKDELEKIKEQMLNIL